MLNLKLNKNVKRALTVVGATSVLAAGFVFGINYNKEEKYINNAYDNSITYEELSKQSSEGRESHDPCKFTGEVEYLFRMGNEPYQTVELVLNIGENRELVVAYFTDNVNPDIQSGDKITVSGYAGGRWDLAGDNSDKTYPYVAGFIFE